MPRKPRTPKCNFCGRPADRVRLLLTGRIKGSFICDVCILKAMHGLVDKFVSNHCAAGTEPLTDLVPETAHG